MKTIFKYSLALIDEQEVQMPGSPELFKVGLDPAGELCVWALVDPKQPQRLQKFFVVGTGYPVPRDAHNWIGRVNQGAFVWHVFTP